MRLAASTIFAVASMLGCGVDTERAVAPIVGGAPATAEEIAGTVAVNARGHVCGGTLVAPDLVVTAAHCVAPLDAAFAISERIPAAEITVLAGVLSWEAATAGETYAVARVEVHPRYPSFDSVFAGTGLGVHHDIALLELARDVDTAAPVPILAVADLDRYVVAGATALVAGYGFISVDSSEEGVLHVARSPVVDRSTHEVLIGGPGQPDSCSGDSGGPAYLELADRTVLIGAASRKRFDSSIDCGEGALYTLVPAYADWIASRRGEAPDAGMSDAGMSDAGSTPTDASGCAIVGPRSSRAPILLVLLGVLSLRRARRAAVHSERSAREVGNPSRRRATSRQLEGPGVAASQSSRADSGLRYVRGAAAP